MRAGQLRQRVTIQQGTAAKDEYGEDILTWSTFATVWARVEPLKGDEFLAARQAAAVAMLDTRITIRYVSGVTPEMRVSYDGNLYNIEAVIDPDERHIEMQLMCKRIIE